MNEYIPLTDFDQRYFPDITEDEKVNFIMNSNAFERINHKFEQIQSFLLIPSKADPAVSGQMRCIHLVMELAKDIELIPKPDKINYLNFDNHFPWLRKLHKNLLYDFATKGEELSNVEDYPTIQDLGNYRQEEKMMGNRKMPDPENIIPLLTQSFKDYAHTYYHYYEGIQNPILMEIEDWEKLEQSIYQHSINICCIKPFKEGSNRIARLTENLLRLNTGLKFKIRQDKNLYLKDVIHTQDSVYKNTPHSN